MQRIIQRPRCTRRLTQASPAGAKGKQSDQSVLNASGCPSWCSWAAYNSKMLEGKDIAWYSEQKSSTLPPHPHCPLFLEWVWTNHQQTINNWMLPESINRTKQKTQMSQKASFFCCKTEGVPPFLGDWSRNGTEAGGGSEGKPADRRWATMATTRAMVAMVAMSWNLWNPHTFHNGGNGSL